MRVLELCAGYGGLFMGLQLAGLDVELLAYAEIDKYASAIMEAHHPGVPNFGDIKVVDWRTVMPPDSPTVDILTAGYP